MWLVKEDMNSTWTQSEVLIYQLGDEGLDEPPDELKSDPDLPSSDNLFFMQHPFVVN